MGSLYFHGLDREIVLLGIPALVLNDLIHKVFLRTRRDLRA